MDKKEFDFINLEKEPNVPVDENGIFFYDKNTFKLKFTAEDYVKYKKTLFYSKKCKDECGVTELATSKLYNELGITTPPTYLFSTGSKKSSTYLISQDLKSATDMDIIVGKDLFDFKTVLDNYKLDPRNKWEILTNKKIKELLLQYITEDCFEQMISVLLLDELRTELDRHFYNYFFCKRKDSDRYEFFVPIDHELTQLSTNPCISSSSFKDFLKNDYMSEILFNSYDNLDYVSRIKAILKLIHKGLISNRQIKLLRQAINMDFPSIIRQTQKNQDTCRYIETTATSYDYLWDYHQNNIGREL